MGLPIEFCRDLLASELYADVIVCEFVPSDRELWHLRIPGRPETWTGTHTAIVNTATALFEETIWPDCKFIDMGPVDVEVPR